MLYSTGHNFTRLFRSLFEFLSEFSRNSNDWLKKTHSTVFTDHVTIRELPSSAISHPIQSSTSSLWLASQGPYNYRYSKYYYYHGSCFSATLIHSAFGSLSISRPVHFTPFELRSIIPPSFTNPCVICLPTNVPCPSHIYNATLQ